MPEESWIESLSHGFEKRLMDSFPEIRKRMGAWLQRNYPHMVPAGKKGMLPVYRHARQKDSEGNDITKASHVDIDGWQPVLLSEYVDAKENALLAERFKSIPGERKVSIPVLIEAKSNSKFLQSMRIVGMDQQGSGMAYEQLEELAALHIDGGRAGVIWNNAGILGYLGGEEIHSAFWEYEKSKIQISAGQKAAHGVRSISWSLFKEVKGQDPWSWYEEGFYPRKDKK